MLDLFEVLGQPLKCWSSIKDYHQMERSSVDTLTNNIKAIWFVHFFQNKQNFRWCTIFFIFFPFNSTITVFGKSVHKEVQTIQKLMVSTSLFGGPWGWGGLQEVQWVQQTSVLWPFFKQFLWKLEATTYLGCQKMTCLILVPVPGTFSLFLLDGINIWRRNIAS